MHLILLQCPNKITPDNRKFIMDLSPVVAAASSVLKPMSTGMSMHGWSLILSSFPVIPVCMQTTVAVKKKALFFLLK